MHLGPQTSAALAGRTVLVTGAAQGIGAGIARRMALEGAAVVVLDLDLPRLEPIARELDAVGARVHAVAADLASLDAIAAAAAALDSSPLGRPDVLVNNAGIQLVSPAIDTSPDLFDRTVSVNLRALLFLAQALARRWVGDGCRGAVVNIASIAGQVHFADHVAYSVAKAGVRALTGALAFEWARYGIRVNAVAPGHTDTPLLLAKRDPARLAARLATIPLGRLAQPDDIARVVAFLASERASYLTGQTVVVDGGYTLQ